MSRPVPASVADAEADRDDDLRLIAGVECLRRVAERLEFEAAVHVPRPVVGIAAERYRADRRQAEEAELVVDAGQLVVVLQAETDLDRELDAEVRIDPARRDTDLQVGARQRPAVRLAEA